MGKGRPPGDRRRGFYQPPETGRRFRVCGKSTEADPGERYGGLRARIEGATNPGAEMAGRSAAVVPGTGRRGAGGARRSGVMAFAARDAGGHSSAPDPVELVSAAELRNTSDRAADG